MNFIAEVRIVLKSGITDPEGMSTKKALELLGFKNIKELRSIKIFEIELEGKKEGRVKEEVEKMCERLLVNPVIHSYSISIRKI